MSDTKSAGELADRPTIEWFAKEISKNANLMMIGQASYLQHIAGCADAILERLRSLPQPGAGEIAKSWGWFELKRGWYHAFAEQYHGWAGYPVCYSSAEEVCEKENLTSIRKPGAGDVREALEHIRELVSEAPMLFDDAVRNNRVGGALNVTWGDLYALSTLSTPTAAPSVEREIERERCVAICEGWISSYQGRKIKFTSAREYALDAIEDIIDLIRNGHNPRALAEQPRSEEK